MTRSAHMLGLLGQGQGNGISLRGRSIKLAARSEAATTCPNQEGRLPAFRICVTCMPHESASLGSSLYVPSVIDGINCRLTTVILPPCTQNQGCQPTKILARFSTSRASWMSWLTVYSIDRSGRSLPRIFDKILSAFSNADADVVEPAETLPPPCARRSFSGSASLP